MEAYILATIGGDQKSLDQSDKTFRVLDLSPDIINRVIDVPYNRMIKLLNDGITMPGITLSYGSIYYYNSNILNCVPHLKSERAVSKKVVALRQIYSNTGDHELIIANCKGQLSKISLAEVMQNNLSKYIVNVDFKRTEYTNRYPVVMSGDYFYKILTPDNKLLHTIGIPDDNKINKNIQIDSNYKTGLPIFDDWIDTQYFEDIMTANDISYSLFGSTLGSIDSSIPVLNIPVGVVSVQSSCINFSRGKQNIKVIRIPNTVTVLENGCFSGLKNVKVIWQGREDDYELDVQGLMGLLSDVSEYKANRLVPLNIGKAFGFFCGTTYGSGDFSSFKQLKLLKYSCQNNLRLMDGIILPDSLKEINGCFQNCDMFDRDNLESMSKSYELETTFTIKMPKDLVGINNSFIALSGIDSVDFSNAQDLEYIIASFNHIHGIKKIDLSECKSLRTITDSFFGLPDLEEVILPDNLSEIGSSVFSDCPKLKNLIIPDSVVSISYDVLKGSGVTELVIPSNVKSCRGVNGINRIYRPREALTAGVLGVNRYGNKVKLEGVKTICASALVSAIVDNIEFPNDIEHLEKGCFDHLYGSRLNIYDWNIISLPENCFNESTIKELILPHNLSDISNDTFVGLTKLEKMFIPSTLLKLGKQNINKIGESLVGGTEYYVIKNSSIEKELVKAGKRVNTFDNDEDAINNLLGLTGTSSYKAQSKARLALNNSNDPYVKEFTSPQYIKDVQLLMNIYKEINSKVKIDDSNIKLMTSKLRIALNMQSIMENQLSIIPNYTNKFGYLYNYSDIILKSSCDDALRDLVPKLTTQFKLLSNIITMSSEPLSFVKTSKDYIRLMSIVNKDANIKVIYYDEYSLIFTHYLEVDLNGTQDRIVLWHIVVGGRVVYLTAEIDSHYDKNNALNMIFEYAAIPNGIGLDEYKDLSNNEEIYRIDKVFRAGDYVKIRFGENMKLGGAEIPPILAHDILEGLKNMVIPVSAYTSLNQFKLAILSMVDGTLMICNSNIPTSTEFTNLFSQSYLNILSVEPYGQWSKESVKLISDNLFKTNNRADEILKQSALKEDSLNILRNKAGAFDPLEPCFEWNLSKALNECKIDSIGRLNSNNIGLVFKSGFFAKARKNIEDLEDLESFKDVNLSDGSIIHIKYPNRRSSSMMIGYDVKFYSYLEIPGEPFANTVDCYSSSKSIVSIFSVIKSIYSSTAKSYGYLKEEFADPEDFKCIWEASLAYSDTKVGLAVNRSDGVIYAYSRIFNQAFLPMFRFKNSDDAMKFGSLLYKDAESYTSKNIKVPIREIVKEMASYTLKVYRAGFEDANKSRFDRMITDTRNHIIDGYPNGYIISGDAGKLFELCAKQPPDPDNIK